MKINVDFIYPIGSVYISTESTNPSVLFGGKWTQTAKSRAIVGTGSNISNTDNVVDSGYLGKALYAGWGNKSQNGWITQSVSQTNGGNWETASAGGDQAHNNIMPIEVYYIWKRVA